MRVKKPHDSDSLNYDQRLYIDLVVKRLERCHLQNIGEASAFGVARSARRTWM